MVFHLHPIFQKSRTTLLVKTKNIGNIHRRIDDMIYSKSKSTLNLKDMYLVWYNEIKKYPTLKLDSEIKKCLKDLLILGVLYRLTNGHKYVTFHHSKAAFQICTQYYTQGYEIMNNINPTNKILLCVCDSKSASLVLEMLTHNFSKCQSQIYQLKILAAKNIIQELYNFRGDTNLHQYIMECSISDHDLHKIINHDFDDENSVYLIPISLKLLQPTCHYIKNIFNIWAASKHGNCYKLFECINKLSLQDQYKLLYQWIHGLTLKGSYVEDIDPDIYNILIRKDVKMVYLNTYGDGKLHIM